MGILEVFLNLIFLWEKLAYLSSISLGEYNKVASFIRDPLILLAALGIRGIKPTKWQVGGFIVLSFIVSVLVGWWLIKLGVPQYSNSIANQNNLQVSQILSNQQLILEKLK